MKIHPSIPKFFIIFVDDEEKSIKYFVKIFEHDFKIITTTNPYEVLKIIDDNPREIAVVISDQKMPQINGVDLLSAVKEKNPNIIRVLTTAYANLEDNIEAINKSNVFAYLTKPWEISKVKEVLYRALNEFESRQNYLSLSGSIAHEMRNPLNSVRQSTDFVKEKLAIAALNEKFCCDSDQEKITPLKKKDFEEIIESLEIAFSSAKRGNILIDIILDSIRQKPVDTSNFKDYSVLEIMNSVMSEYTFSANEKEKVTVNIAPQHDFIMRCNDTLLSYVFFNLLKNSLYYLKSNPHLTISIKSVSGIDDFNRIYISDNGPGIPKNKLQNLFEAFSTSGKEGGTGLGLSFCKKTMSSFGGSISCNSVEGEFSEFILAFPKIVKRDKSNSVNRLLIIDELEINLLTERKLLEESLNSTKCDFAKNSAEALKMLNENSYDLVLINIEKNKEESIFIAKKIKDLDVLTPIVAYSPQEFEFTKSPQFDDYLTKSASENLLIKTISKWSLIKLKKPLVEESEIVNFLKNKKILLADDENVNLILTTKYLEKYDVTTSEVRDGEEAVKMAQKNNYDLILMDISMPELDGIKAVKKIRKFQQKNNLKTTPIIAFTGNCERQKIYEILKAGFDDYFIKGADYKLLAQSITLIGKKKGGV